MLKSKLERVNIYSWASFIDFWSKLGEFPQYSQKAAIDVTSYLAQFPLIEQNSSRVIPCQVIQQTGDFSSDPNQNSRNFIRRKISGFWAQQSWNFWNRTHISKIMSIWNFDVFYEDWTKKLMEFCCGNFNWLSLLYLWIFSFNILVDFLAFGIRCIRTLISV